MNNGRTGIVVHGVELWDVCSTETVVFNIFTMENSNGVEVSYSVNTILVDITAAGNTESSVLIRKSSVTSLYGINVTNNSAHHGISINQCHNTTLVDTTIQFNGGFIQDSYHVSIINVSLDSFQQRGFSILHCQNLVIEMSTFKHLYSNYSLTSTTNAIDLPAVIFIYS